MIYGAECKICCKQYTGKTDNQLRTRIAGHRTQVNRNTPDAEEEKDLDESALADHLADDHNYNTVNMFNSSYKFTILERDPSDIDKAEQHWISKMVTLTPFGLNREKPLCVSDTLLTMSQKSSNSQRH